MASRARKHCRAQDGRDHSHITSAPGKDGGNKDCTPEWTNVVKSHNKGLPQIQHHTTPPKLDVGALGTGEAFARPGAGTSWKARIVLIVS